MATSAKKSRSAGRKAAPALPLWLTLEGHAKRHIDPYTVWALHSDFRAFARNGQLPDVLDFLVQLEAPYDPQVHRWDALPPGTRAVVPAIYAEPLPGTCERASFISVRLHIGADTGAPESASASASDSASACARAAAVALMLHPAVLRAQIGIPQPPLPSEPLAPGSILGKSASAGSDRPKPPARPKVVMAALEDACPFAHQSLRGPDNRTRVAALWDQSAVQASKHDPAPAGLGYGRERSPAQLHALMDRYTQDGRIDEERLYVDPASLQQRVRLSFGSHAAAVLTLLAGDQRQLPCLPGRVATRALDNVRSAARARDAAALAPLVVVQLPREQIDVAGSRWFTVRALDGLRYIMAQACRLGGSGRKPTPLVVNVSYGSIAGAHDGSALLESATQELVQGHGTMTVVLAAGNAAGGALRAEGAGPLSRKPRGFHAQKDPLAPGAQASLRVLVPPEMARETYVEIWFEPATKGQAKHSGPLFLGPREVFVEVESPVGERMRVTRFPGTDFDNSEPQRISSGLLAFSRVAQSQQRSMALLVIGATALAGERPAAPSGHWTVRVHNRGERALNVQAWVERDWVPRSGQPTQRAWLQRGPAGQGSFELNDKNTLNNIATGTGVVRVGAAMALGPALQPKASPYTSAPAAGARPIEFFAVADESPAKPGIRVCGNLTGSVNRMNGTSIAAPQVARWLAGRLAAGDTRDQCIPQVGAKDPAAPSFGQTVGLDPPDKPAAGGLPGRQPNRRSKPK